MSRTSEIRAAGRLFIAAVLVWTSAATVVAAGAPRVVRAVDLGGLETRSAALLLSAEEAGDLAISALAIPLPAAGGSSRVIVAVEIGGASLRAGLATENLADSGDLLAEVYAYALDATGALAATLTQAFRLEPSTDGRTIAAGDVVFVGHLDLAPGEHSLRILVLHRASGRLGLRVLPLAVPAERAGGRTALAPPLALQTAEGRILVQQEGEASFFPVTIGGQAWLPAAARPVEPGPRAGYLVFGRGLDGAARAVLLGSDRQAIRELSVSVPAPFDGPPGLEAVVAEIDTAGLAAGPYALEISTRDAEAAASATLVVRTPEQPSTGSGETAEGRPAPRPAPGGRVERRDRARAAYQRALRSLVAGDFPAAVAILAEMERAEIGSGSNAERKDLTESQLAIAVDVALRDAEGLVPLMRLHDELYRRYHRAGSYQLATHARQLTMRILELYAERRRSAEAGHLVACALVSMAAHLHAAGALPAAGDLYRGALERDPEHPAALLGLATLREHFGDYQAAADLLKKRLAAGAPEPEARLRLAVNYRRLESGKKASKLLREVIDGPGPEWLAAIAAQELADLLAAENRVPEAIGVLERAIERHADVQRLRIQLASLLDRDGRPSAARSVLEDLDPRAGREESSPRLRYSRLPSSALAEARRTLTVEAERRLPALGRAAGLDAATAGGR